MAAAARPLNSYDHPDDSPPAAGQPALRSALRAAGQPRSPSRYDDPPTVA